MPIYEYRCNACDVVFEVFQKMSDPAPVEHACGGKDITRLLSNTSFRLVGTGWYATDYAAKPKPSKSESDTAGPKDAPPAKDGKAGAKEGSKPKAEGKKRAEGAS